MSRYEFAAGDEITAAKLNKNIIGGSYNAGETINGATLPVPVYQDTSDNEFYACDADDTDKLNFVGFAISNGTDGNPIDIQFNGIVKGFSGLDEGEKYYVQDTAGTIGKTPGQNKVLVGVAVSTTEILITKREIESNHFIGAGDTKEKGFWNFTIPLLVGGHVSDDIWTPGNMDTVIFGGILHLSPGADVINYLRMTNEIFALNFGTSKKVIVEFGLRLGGASGEQGSWGLSPASADIIFTDYDNQDYDSASFSIDASGNLYAHTADAGVGHTETAITGISLTNLNTYRIEFDPGVDVKFYVNGTLKATITTTLPNSGVIKLGFGTAGSSGSCYVSCLTTPNISIEK